MVPINLFGFNHPRFTSLLNRHKQIPQDIMDTVTAVINEVKEQGEEALFKYMQKFDNIDLKTAGLQVTDEEFDRAASNIPPEYGQALKEACDNLFRYHQFQLPKSYKVDYPDGVVLERQYKPIERVGVCVPGQAAPLSSTLYMNLIPALVAGVPEISIISTPRNNTINDYILFIADYLGIRNVYKISGAQGIAALAYGTENIPSVDKIVGPGNIYVTTAKRLVYGTVGIDSLAGPSEVAIIADETAPAAYVAADMLSQAEHGTGLEASIVFCLSEDKAKDIKEKLLALVVKNNLEKTVARSLREYGNIFVVEDLQTAIDAVNALAPEHAEVICRDAAYIASSVTNAGAVFVGPYSPEPVGDYYCGTNHVLPTGGTARFSSGLTVMDFMRSYSIINYTQKALEKHQAAIEKLAAPEGMAAHILSLKVRRGMDTLPGIHEA